MILTKTLFLLSTHCVNISFESNEIVFQVENDETQYIIAWRYPENILKILWMFLESTKYASDLSYSYDEYRQHTRSITDNLAEDHNPRKTWFGILDLTNDYFSSVDV